MSEVILKFVLSISSFSGVLFFFVVTKQDIPLLSLPTLPISGIGLFLAKNAIYAVTFLFLAYLTLILSGHVFRGGETLKVVEIKPIESVAVPTYIGMFVISIGLAQSEATPGLVSATILFALFIFWRKIEKIFYFNPIWLIFGYRFYEVRTEKGNTYTFITKRDRLKGSDNFGGLNRINNYTYFER